MPKKTTKRPSGAQQRRSAGKKAVLLAMPPALHAALHEAGYLTRQPLTRYALAVLEAAARQTLTAHGKPWPENPDESIPSG